MRRVLFLLTFSFLLSSLHAQLKVGVQAGYGNTSVKVDGHQASDLSLFGGVVVKYSWHRIALRSGLITGNHSFIGYRGVRSPMPGSQSPPQKETLPFWDITFPLVVTYSHKRPAGEWYGGGGYAFSLLPGLLPMQGGSLVLTTGYKFHHSNLFLHLDGQPCFSYKGRHEYNQPYIAEIYSQVRLGAGLWFGRKGK
jgi:hypothetical protein